MYDQDRLTRALRLIGYKLVGDKNGVVWFMPDDPVSTEYEPVTFDFSRGPIPQRDVLRQLFDSNVSSEDIGVVTECD